MNILQISTYDMKGGAAQIAWSLKEQLETRGHRTSMFVAHKLSTKANVYQIRHNIFERLLSAVCATDLDFFQSDSILRTKQYRNADIVHCHNLHGYYFNLSTLQKMAREKPVVWTLHDMWSITPHCAHAFDGSLQNGFYQCPSRNIYPSILWSNEKYLQWKKNKIYQNSSIKIVVPSRWLEQKVKTSVLQNQHISLIYNGVDTSIYHPYDTLKMRKRLNLPLEKTIILFIADGWKKTPWKGLNYLNNVIESYKDNINVLFLIIGGNNSNIKFTHSNVKVVPFLTDRSKLAQYYSSSDMLLMTSIAENFPLTMLEAMACGLPVVSFDVGGVKEAIIHKKNGYIAQHKDIHDIIRGIEYIQHIDIKSRQRMKKNSTTRATQDFSIDDMTDRYIQLYSSII